MCNPTRRRRRMLRNRAPSVKTLERFFNARFHRSQFDSRFFFSVSRRSEKNSSTIVSRVMLTLKGILCYNLHQSASPPLCHHHTKDKSATPSYTLSILASSPLSNENESSLRKPPETSSSAYVEHRRKTSSLNAVQTPFKPNACLLIVRRSTKSKPNLDAAI